MSAALRSTSYQVTRFYRPPELLLDSEYYRYCFVAHILFIPSYFSCLVDVWSAGCCVGEMLKGQPLFCGKDVKNQLKLVVLALGSPTNEDIM